MKQNLLLLVALLLLGPLSAQNWQWAAASVANTNALLSCMVTDGFGNIYAAGQFSTDSLVFGNKTIFNPISGEGAPYIVKYDPNGIVLWAKLASQPIDNVTPIAIATDSRGNVYLTGYYQDSMIIFGTDTLQDGPGSLTNTFLAKYDANGNVQWATQPQMVHEGDPNQPSGLCTDSRGNVYLSGTFDFSITFDTITLTNPGAVGSGGYLYLAKYDTSGNLLWAKGSTGPVYNIVTSGVTADPWGNVYVGGGFDGRYAIFGTDTLVASLASFNISGSQPYADNFFFVKYDASGNVVWAKSTGGDGNEALVSVSADVYGNIYGLGTFYSDSITLGSHTLYNYRSDTLVNNAFVVKYDTAGTALWAKPIGGTRYQSSRQSFFTPACINAGISGNIYVCGAFASSVLVLDTIVLRNGYSEQQFFLAKYDGAGNLLWAKPGGGRYNSYNSTEVATCVTTDFAENVFLGGIFTDSSIVFGPDTLYTNQVSTFVAKLGSPLSCNAHFVLYPDSTIAHHWFALNQCTGTGTLNYVWTWGDGNSSSTGADPSHIYSAPGYYHICVTITDSLGCSSSYCDSTTYERSAESSMVTVNVVGPTYITLGLTQISSGQSLTIYPNPSGGLLNIATVNFWPQFISIYNINGQQIIQQMYEPQIDVSKLSSGMYFIELKSENNVVRNKFIKL